MIKFICVALFVCTCSISTYAVDYDVYRQHMPRSILILPPLNHTSDPQATYSYLSTLTIPVANAGYYVYPVAVIDAYLKENGLGIPEDMHTVDLSKFSEIIGPDAVLYVEILDYGQDYQVIDSVTKIRVKSRLVDVKSGIELWRGEGSYSQSHTSHQRDLDEKLVAALFTQILNGSSDSAYDKARHANHKMFRGLLKGPYHPSYNSEPVKGHTLE